MQQVFLLIRAFYTGTKPLRALMDRVSLTRGEKPTSRILTIVLGLLLSCAFLTFALLLGVNYYSYQTLGALLGRPYLGLFLASLVSGVLTFLFSITSISNILYTAKDLTLLQSLAIPKHALVASRLMIIYGSFAPLYWFLMLPALVVGVFIDGITANYVFGSLVHLLFGPLVPLALSSFFALLFMGIFKGRRHQRTVELLGMVLMVVCIVGLSTLLSRNSLNGSELAFDYQAMSMHLEPILDTLQTVFFLAQMQAQIVFSLTDLGLFSLLGLVVSGGCSWIIFSTYDYFGLLAAQTQDVWGKKILTLEGRKPQSQTRTLLNRELVVLKSESVFLFELAGEVFIPLLLFCIYALTGVTEELATVVSPLMQLPVFPFLLVLVLLLFSNINSLSSTSVSRQGKHFVLDRQYPLSAHTVVRAKILLHMVLFGSANGVYLLVSVLLLKVELFHLLWMLPCSLLAIYTVAHLHLYLDYRNPHLNWALAQQAMKSNPNTLVAMVVSLLYELGLAILLLPMYFNWIPLWLAWPLFFGVLIWLGVLSRNLAYRQAHCALTM